MFYTKQFEIKQMEAQYESGKALTFQIRTLGNLIERKMNYIIAKMSMTILHHAQYDLSLFASQ